MEWLDKENAKAVEQKMAELRKHLRERCDKQLADYGIVYSDGVALACLEGDGGDYLDEVQNILVGLVQRIIQHELGQRSDLSSNGDAYIPRKVRRPPAA